MAHLESRMFIAAGPRAVWAVLADLDRQGAWMVDVRSLEVTAPPHGRGSVLRVTSTLFGLPLVHDVMEVTAWEPPRRIRVCHRGQVRGVGEFLITPCAGGVMITWSEDVAAPFGRLGEALFALVVRPHLLRVFARSLSNLGRRCQGDAASA